MSPSTASNSMSVVVPTRLLSSVRLSIRPFLRSTSNTENGRRSSGVDPWPSLTMTNWPGALAEAMSVAARAMTL